MELLVIPFLVITGLAFLLLGANGLGSNGISAGNMAFSQGAMPSLPRGRAASQRSWFSHQAKREPGSAKGPELNKPDVLLADLMAEMLQMREQLAALRQEVASLNSPPTQVEETDAKPRRQRRSRAA